MMPRNTNAETIWIQRAVPTGQSISFRLGESPLKSISSRLGESALTSLKNLGLYFFGRKHGLAGIHITLAFTEASRLSEAAIPASLVGHGFLTATK